MDALRLIMLTGSIGATLLGSLYAGAAAERGEMEFPSLALPSSPAPGAPTEARVRVEAIPPPPPPALVPEAVHVPALLDPVARAIAENAEDLVDTESGMHIGPLTWRSAQPAASEQAPPPAPSEQAEPSSRGPRHAARRADAQPTSAGTSRARRRSAPRPAPGPRLHPDPGMHVIMTARQMIARRELVQGSCYRYLAEVFERAGHRGWRTRRTVFQGNRNGPYANLDLVRPGDWLYIVNHPERTPVGTHSVLFVGWENRALGHARVIEHSGWGAASPGRERGYDISRTYRITRPILRR